MRPRRSAVTQGLTSSKGGGSGGPIRAVRVLHLIIVLRVRRTVIFIAITEVFAVALLFAAAQRVRESRSANRVLKTCSASQQRGEKHAGLARAAETL